MQELTDNPKYREGQPTYGEVVHLPFFNEALGLESSVQQVLEKIRWHIERYPTQFAGITMELVQGEGGFRFAPKAFYERIFEEAKKHGLAIWIDEVQTFGRTGEYFAFQKFGLEKWVDVVTVGKMLQACATLYSHEYNPKPGLVAGTFSGSTVALKTAFRTLRLLEQEGHLGNEGRTAKLSALFRERLLRTQKKLPGKIGQVRVVGGMVAYEPSPGTLEHCKLVLTRLFDAGVVAFYCGHGPYLIRMLPPLGAMTEDHVNRVCDLIESTL
jgi:4-aminobutyrate aminotransferase-like enzyme